MPLTQHLRSSAIAFLFLASCTNSADRSQAPSEATPHEFSDADKKIARSLSLGNESLLGEAIDAHQEASICRDAITAIEQRLRSTGILSGEMGHSLELAKDIYARRVAAQSSTPGANAGPSAEAADVRQGESPTQFDQGRTALACIQRLQGERH